MWIVRRAQGHLPTDLVVKNLPSKAGNGGLILVGK